MKYRLGLRLWLLARGEMMAKAITGIILAGGKSKRMGTDKARLAWGKGTLIEHVIEELRSIVDEIIVAVDEAGRFRNLNAKIIEDVIPGAHALGGLYTGLRMASHERCFVCGCDAPFLNAGLVRFLIAQANGYDLVIPRSEYGLEPLHAVYERRALPAIEEQLSQKRWNLTDLVPKLRANIIDVATLRQYDPEGLSFLNLNTKEAYTIAYNLHLEGMGGIGIQPPACGKKLVNTRMPRETVGVVTSAEIDYC